MQVGIALILILDPDLAKALFPFLDRVRYRILHRERDLISRRRPCEAGDAFLAAGQPLRLAAADGNPMQLALAVAIGDEGKPLAVVRPRRLQARAARVGDLPRLSGGGVPDPDLGLVSVAVPIRFANRESDVQPVG